MSYYLKWSESSGSNTNNRELAQISGISGAFTLKYKLAEDCQPLTESRYILDIRRRAGIPSDGGGTGYLLESATTGLNSTGTTGHKINDVGVDPSAFFNALAGDICEVSTTEAPSEGVVAFGSRFNEVESFYGLAVHEITIIDTNGTHIIDMATSGGSGLSLTSDTGTITMDLFRFADAGSPWVTYYEYEAPREIVRTSTTVNTSHLCSPYLQNAYFFGDYSNGYFVDSVGGRNLTLQGLDTVGGETVVADETGAYVSAASYDRYGFDGDTSLAAQVGEHLGGSFIIQVDARNLDNNGDQGDTFVSMYWGDNRCYASLAKSRFNGYGEYGLLLRNGTNLVEHYVHPDMNATRAINVPYDGMLTLVCNNTDNNGQLELYFYLDNVLMQHTTCTTQLASAALKVRLQSIGTVNANSLCRYQAIYTKASSFTQNEIEEAIANPYAVLEPVSTADINGAAQDYGLRLRLPEESFTLPTVGAYNLTIHYALGETENVTGTGAYAFVSGDRERHFDRITGTDSEGSLFYSFNVSSGTDIPEFLQGKNGTVSGLLPDPHWTSNGIMEVSGWHPIWDYTVYQIGTGLDYADLNVAKAATRGLATVWELHEDVTLGIKFLLPAEKDKHLTIRPKAGFGVDALGAAAIGFRDDINNDQTAIVLYANEAEVTLENVAFYTDDSYSQPQVAIASTGRLNSLVTVKNCHINNDTGSGYYARYAINAGTHASNPRTRAVIENNTLISTVGRAVAIGEPRRVDTQTIVRNNIVIGGSSFEALRVDNTSFPETQRIENNIVINYGTDPAFTITAPHTVVRNNLTSDTSGDIPNVNFYSAFKDSANNDYRVNTAFAHSNLSGTGYLGSDVAGWSWKTFRTVIAYSIGGVSSDYASIATFFNTTKTTLPNRVYNCSVKSHTSTGNLYADAHPVSGWTEVETIYNFIGENTIAGESVTVVDFPSTIMGYRVYTDTTPLRHINFKNMDLLCSSIGSLSNEHIYDLARSPVSGFENCKITMSGDASSAASRGYQLYFKKSIIDAKTTTANVFYPLNGDVSQYNLTFLDSIVYANTTGIVFRPNGARILARNTIMHNAAAGTICGFINSYTYDGEGNITSDSTAVDRGIGIQDADLATAFEDTTIDDYRIKQTFADANLTGTGYQGSNVAEWSWMGVTVSQVIDFEIASSEVKTELSLLAISIAEVLGSVNTEVITQAEAVAATQVITLNSPQVQTLVESQAVEIGFSFTTNIPALEQLTNVEVVDVSSVLNLNAAETEVLFQTQTFSIDSILNMTAPATEVITQAVSISLAEIDELVSNPTEIKTETQALDFSQIIGFDVVPVQTLVNVNAISLQNITLVDVPALEVISNTESIPLSQVSNLNASTVELLSQAVTVNLDTVDLLVAAVAEQLTENELVSVSSDLHFFVVNSEQLTESEAFSSYVTQSLNAVETEQKTNTTIIDILDQASLVVVQVEHKTETEALDLTQQLQGEIIESEVLHNVTVSDIGQSITLSSVSTEQLSEISPIILVGTEAFSVAETEVKHVVNSVSVDSLVNFVGPMTEQLTTIDIINIVARNLSIDPENIIPLGSNVLFKLTETTRQFRLTMR